MSCQQCNSERIFSVTGKTSDLCFVGYDDGSEHDGYVPHDIGIGGGDCIQFAYCAECGQIQGQFPVERPEKESDY